MWTSSVWKAQLNEFSKLHIQVIVTDVFTSHLSYNLQLHTELITISYYRHVTCSFWQLLFF